MDKITKKYGHYFTFPLKFLHVSPAEYKERFAKIIHWAIYALILRDTSAYSASNYDKEQRIRTKLNFKGGKLSEWKSDWKELQNLMTGGEIFTSVKTDYLFEARDGKLNPDLLLLVAAVKSVIGKYNFKHTYMMTIVQRMYGNPDHLTRHSFNKLCNTACAKGMMTKLPAGRGFYVSIRYKSDQLAEAVMSRITRYQAEMQKQVEAGKKIAALKRNYQIRIERAPNSVIN